MRPQRDPLPSSLDAGMAVSQRTLAISRSVVNLYIDAASSDFTIRDLARHVGVSERTFYRYFPRKEDVIRPFLSAGLHRVVDAFVANAETDSIKTALATVWSQSWVAREADRSRVLFEVIGADDALRAVWFQIIIESETRWAQAIAHRLAIEPRSPQALLAGAVVVAASRLSGRTGADNEVAVAPADVFAANLDLIGPALFTRRQTEAPAGRR